MNKKFWGTYMVGYALWSGAWVWARGKYLVIILKDMVKLDKVDKEEK